MKAILLIASIIIQVGISNSSKLLLLSPLGSKSHLNAFMGMFKLLAERGHQLTIVSAYGNSQRLNNISDVIIPSEFRITQLGKHVFEEGSSGAVLTLLMKTPQLCVGSLATDVVQNLKKDQFDLILISVFMSDCYLSLVHHFKVPFIYLSPSGFVGIFNKPIGNPYFISLSGSILLAGKYPFGYFYRLKATLVDFLVESIMTFHTLAKTESLCRERGLCPQNMPAFSEFRANASLGIANSIKLLNPSPVPDMPHVIYAGGSHCGPAKPLPQELEKWVDDSGEEGFIYFSLGSVVTPSDMPNSLRKIFINVFRKLKQRVLWKWDGIMDDLPSNVKLEKWLPQQDILAHPKLRLFISHGGLLSIMESAYHGAKILGMPLFADQHNNIQAGVVDGWADSFHWKGLTEEALERKILATITNDNMDAVIDNRAKIMKDQPRSPQEDVIYWIEYVLRHDGAVHLRSPVYNMPLYILYNADVWFTIFVFLLGLLAVFFFLVKKTFNSFFGKAKIKFINKMKKKQ